MQAARPRRRFLFAKVTGVTALAICGLYGTIGVPNRVEGTSMSPTLEPGDWVFVHPWRKPERGAIVAIRFLGMNNTIMIKRLLAIQGDSLPNQPNTKIGEDLCWIEGDNPATSVDSRTLGLVPFHDVVGVATYRIDRNWQFSSLAAALQRD